MYLQHCDMLKKFGESPDPAPKDKKRSSKQKKKLANLLLAEKLSQMRQELSQIHLLDQTLEQMRHEQKNL
jgi:hypothetical protein